MNNRQKEITALLEKNGEMTIRELSDRLGVTAMTIHRDLDVLEENRFIYKKRGAAVFVNAPDRLNSRFYADEKRAVAKAAAELIKPGQSVIFDNSTTVIEAARFLEGIPNLTFYTTNIEIAAIVSNYSDTVLYCSGGYYFKDSRGFIGRQAEMFAESVHADICLIGASGIDIEGGLSDPYPSHTELEKKIIAAADRRILLADHSKFGKRAMEKVAELSEIDLIITDDRISEDILSEYRKHVRIETVHVN